MVRKSKSPMSNNDKKEVIVKQQHIKHYSGIIPHPEIVEGYERNCPGATDRILAMTENQLKSSQEIELSEQNNINECRLTMLKSDVEYNKRGQIFGSITIVIGSVIWNKQKIKIKISDERDFVLSFCFQYITVFFYFYEREKKKWI